jgi:hypothetical protein
MDNPSGNDSYEETRWKAKEFYGNIGCVWCPSLNDSVTFNSAGFRHLIWQGKTLRRQKEQIRRFTLLPDAASILSNLGGDKEQRTIERLSKIDRHGKRTDVKIRIKFWGLAQEISGRRIKVIVRQIGNGKKHFFSIF